MRWPWQSKPKRRKAKRLYEAAGVGRLTSGWVGSTAPHNISIERGLPALRARSRECYENNDHIRAFVRACKTNIIGHRGVVLQSRVMRGTEADQLARMSVEEAWRAWGRIGGGADFTLQRSWWQLENDVVQTCAVDGEYIALKRMTRSGLQLKTLDPEMLPVGYSEDLKNGRYIRQGIEYDRDDRRVGYWFHEEPPNKARSAYVNGYGPHGAKYIRVPADQVVHVFLPEFAVQSRGVPWTAAGLLRLKLLHGYHEAELFAARGAASQMGWLLEGASGDEFEGDVEEGDREDADVDEIEMEPGVFRKLPYGWDVKPPDTSRPNTAFEHFVKSNVRVLAAGLGVSYAQLSGDYSDANYSSMRASQLIEQEVWKTLQTWVVEQWHDPLFDAWLEAAIDTGTLLIGGREPSGPLERYQPRGWQPRRWAWVDPQKEMTAHGMALDRRLKSKSEIIREMGRDPDEVWREIAEENALMESLGLDPHAPAEWPILTPETEQ